MDNNGSIVTVIMGLFKFLFFLKLQAMMVHYYSKNR